jgi:hypothetical protein
MPHYAIWDPVKESADLVELDTHYRTKEITHIVHFRGVKAVALINMMAAPPSYHIQVVSQGQFDKRLQECKDEWAQHNPEGSIEAVVPIEWRAVDAEKV